MCPCVCVHSVERSASMPEGHARRANPKGKSDGKVRRASAKGVIRRGPEGAILDLCHLGLRPIAKYDEIYWSYMESKFVI